MNNNEHKSGYPFSVTVATPTALVRFWLARPSQKAIGKRAFKAYIESLFEPKKAKEVLKHGYFLVDDADAAKQCVQILERVRDMQVSQYVFGARAYSLV